MLDTAVVFGIDKTYSAGSVATRTCHFHKGCLTHTTGICLTHTTGICLTHTAGISHTYNRDVSHIQQTFSHTAGKCHIHHIHTHFFGTSHTLMTPS
jgi:hypothetical protein